VTIENSNRAGKALRGVLACGVSVAVMGLAATPAFAQDVPPAERPIVVTGSRLVTTGMDTPVPVTAVQADELEAMDPTSLIASVTQLPQFMANTTPNFSNFFVRGGTGNLNLRGLGPNRTLTLLNGRRVPATSAFGGVDINLFPEAMISGVETTTGGASAAYGTDAVAGVVNFMLDTDFEGLEANIQGGTTSRGDADNWQGSLTWGTDIGDRGHFIISGSYANQDGVHEITSRDWYNNTGAVNVGGVWKDYADVHSMSSSFDGIISSSQDVDPVTPGVQNPINGLLFRPDGSFAPFVPGSPTSGVVGGAGPTAGRTVGGDGDDLNSEVYTLWPDTERYSVFAYGDYELTDDLLIFGQYMRGYNEQFQWNNPRASLHGAPTAITIFRDNAFLPDEINQLMHTNNIASFNLRRVGSIEDIGDVWFKDKVTQNVGTAGFEYNINSGGFMDGWLVNGYYQYGHSRRVWDQHTLRVDRIFAAMDAVEDGNGNIVCRVSLDPEGAAAFPGCEPLNLFGRGNASPEAIDWVLGNDVGVNVNTPLYFANLGFTGETLQYTSVAPKRNITTFEQHFAEVSAAGDLFDLPAGAVSLAFGASYRDESIYQVVQDTANQASNHDVGTASAPVEGEYHPCTTNALANAALGLRGVNGADCSNTVAHQFSKVSNVQGKAVVKELFAETLVPIFENDQGAAASLNLAVRWADYTGSGSIWAYKGGLDVTVVEGFRLRGTYSRDVRAGNLSERYDKTGGVGNVIDRRTTAENPTWGGQTYQVTVFSGGNPEIQPEKADTFTAGAVLQPTFLPGFSTSVDWYQVKINGAISTVGTQGVVDRCFLDDETSFCDLITVDSSQADKIVLVGNQFVNVAQSSVEGVDAEIGYRSNLNVFGGDESFSARAFMSFLLDRSDTGATGAVTRFHGLTGIAPDTGGFGLFPKFRGTGNITYRNGGFNMFLQGRLIGSGKRSFTLNNTQIEDNNTPSVFYADMRLSYEFPVGDSTLEVFGSVTNLFDKDPPVEGTYSTFTGASTQFNAGLFDVLGRRFTLGAKFRL